VLDLGDDLGLTVRFFNAKVLPQLIDEGRKGMDWPQEMQRRSSNPLASCKSAVATPPAIPSRQLCAVGLNGRTWKISFSVRGCTAEAGTMTTAIVSPTALNTSSA
jgi:hypothetical protein